MENSDSNTANVPSNSDSLSLNNAIRPPSSKSNSDYWLREFIKINQCPQREDALENQLKDLSLVAEKLGMYYASHFIKNINNTKK
ncbi:MAG: hypothetical protein RSE15_02995 [Flavobacterium sp.]|uniref:hypothetical protein n=1 Tax=Flavobacterium sp. TaxID=239 RepID=UPI002B474750|nr:hypothetical protein [Flavobacterium sp.]WRH73805.1 MAG: hypothetical protein RSE15_02995 [Flavobacterium sp.]